jgi:hypothetical protein
MCRASGYRSNAAVCVHVCLHVSSFITLQLKFVKSWISGSDGGEEVSCGVLGFYAV